MPGPPHEAVSAFNGPAPQCATALKPAPSDLGTAPSSSSSSVGDAAEPSPSRPLRLLIIACGALARELAEITRRFDHITVQCLPAKLHNRPEKIPEAVRQRVRTARAQGDADTILVGYMDCGTGGLLDRVCAEEGVERLPGAQCYELFAGSDRFTNWQDEEPGTFYLTDYMVRHFDRIVMDGLGITAHPQLRDAYFGNYTRVVYLAQTDDPHLASRAASSAARLGLRCERVFTGFGGLEQHTLAHGLRLSHNPGDATVQPDTASHLESTAVGRDDG